MPPSHALYTFKQTNGGRSPDMKVTINIQALYGIEDGVELGDLPLNHEIHQMASKLTEMDVKRFLV